MLCISVPASISIINKCNSKKLVNGLFLDTGQFLDSGRFLDKLFIDLLRKSSVEKWFVLHTISRQNISYTLYKKRHKVDSL